MAERTAPLWRKVLAAILDTLLVFFLGGFAIARVTGETTEGGFNLQGASALVLFAVIGFYFWLGNRSGGTVFQRLLRSRG